jgi:8-oxo-dGTP pyrophosphatase MutT (NUDIX family)
MVFTGTFMTDNLICQIGKALQNGLPGAEAQALMAPSLRPPERLDFDTSNPRSSGVMILLFPSNEGISTVFIHRTHWGPHGGQISFPGGKQEPADSDLVVTACRESEEEIGISPNRIRVIGLLTPLYVPYSNYHIQPVVASTGPNPLFIPDNKEVESILIVPLNKLFHPVNRKSMVLTRPGLEITAPYYDADGYRVWGATAMIMSEFEVVLTSCIS